MTSVTEPYDFVDLDGKKFQYILGTLVACGNFGKTSEAKEYTDGISTKRTVILKEREFQIPGSNEDEFEFELHRYSWQFEEIRKIRNSNVTEYYHAKASDGIRISLFTRTVKTVVVMEYGELGNLEFFMKGTSLSHETMHSLVEQILNGLVAIHATKMIHFDLRTSNIVLSHSQTYRCGLNAKITDLDHHITVSDYGDVVSVDVTNIRGAALFMSPEMFSRGRNGHRIGKKTDVWSMGCLIVDLYRKGKELRLVVDINGEQYFYNLSTLDHRSLATFITEGGHLEIPSDVPDSTKTMIERCFRKDPKVRFSAALLHSLWTDSDPFRAEHAADMSRSKTSLGCFCNYVTHRDRNLGFGTYGTVYKATVTDCNNFSGAGAVKIVQLQNSDIRIINEKADNTYLLRWKMLLTLKHLHVIPYHKITIIRNPQGALVEFLMDYAEAGNLASRLVGWNDVESSVDVLTAMCYAMQVTAGISFLHEGKHIIHGDLKPANILCKVSNPACQHYTLLIADLDDLIQMQRSTTVSQDIKGFRGTTKYMSPEMLERYIWANDGETIGRKTDIWSLGCIFLEMVDFWYGNKTFTLYKEGSANLWNFDAEKPRLSELSFATKILDGYIPLVREEFPARFTNLIRSCLQRDSRERLSAKDLLLELNDAVTEYCSANPDEAVTCRQHPHAS